MHPARSLIACTVAALALAPQGGGAARDELTPVQRQALARGEAVVVHRDSAGAPWPAVTVYRLIRATPEEAAAVFTDYGDHRHYIPDVKRSRVARVVDRLTADVDYTLAVPVFDDEDYTVRDHIAAYDGGRGYRVDWTMLRASSARAIAGSVRFEPWGDAGARGATLMAYHNFVVPGSRLAGIGFVRTRALGQMHETARAIAARVEERRTIDPDAIARGVARLRAALAATPARAP